MTRVRCPALAAVILALWPSLSTALLAAAPHDRRAHTLERIRTTDRRMRKLLDQGLRISPSLRALVHRLERSDVVVYVECEGHAQARVAGRLMFVSAAGGLRYVVVRLARLPAAQQIAILAHELQHAVEIAETPAIVDAPSLAREYLRIGHVNRWSAAEGIAFDTDAAVEMGEKVLGEIVAVAGD
jgi:hypothetical protein